MRLTVYVMFKTRHQPVWLRLKRPAKFAFTPSLPRTAVLPVLLWAVWPPAAHAQTHHVDAPERVTRAVGVYEWTGELAKPTAARFVPVSLYIDGHMQDAGLYLARPVPFALQTGDLYALEHAGEPEGLLDLDYAQRVVTGGALAEDAPAAAWYGYGKFTPEAAPKPAAALRPSSHLPVIQANGVPATTTSPATDDGRPHMSRRDTAPAAANPTSTSPGNPGSPNSGTPQSSSTPDPANSGGQTKADSGTTASGSTDTDDTDRPTLRHRDPSQDAARRREYGTKAKQASVTAVGPAPGDDPDRPMLGHNTAVDDSTPPLTGLPAGLHQAVAVSDPVHRDTHNFARDWDSPEERTETLAALEALARPRVRAYLTANALTPSNGPLPAEVDTSGPASTHTPATAPAAGTSATPTPDNLHPANAHPANAHPDSTDPDIPPPPKLQRGVPTQYRSSATATPAAPAPASAAPTPTSSPAPPPPAPHSAAAPPAATAAPRPAVRPGTHRPTRPASLQTASLLLAQGEVTGFSLSYGGLPTFVYTAAAAVTKPTTAPATSSALKSGPGTIAHPAVYVTLVAQRLPSGELQVVMSSVTDSLHLDRSPRMRLVDAVDPDGSHRASLLFELRAASSRQFALYRLTSVQAEQTFTTASIE